MAALFSGGSEAGAARAQKRYEGRDAAGAGRQTAEGDEMDTLDGKTAVVTGGASGMGKAFCERFSRAGMKVVIADVEQAALDAAVSALQRAGAEVVGIRCDVSKAEDNDALLAGARDAFGTVHVVCLNAGVGGENGKSWALSLDDWQWTLGVNLWGVIHGVRSFVPHLVEHGDGHVVTTASIAGHTSSPYGAPYNVSKHGVVTLSETLYNELRREGSTVGVTCLCPGFVATNIVDSARNRPGARGGGGSERDRGGARFVEVVRRLVEQGKPPAEVADLVHNAILEQQFWLFTDTVWDEPIARRHGEIRERRPPTFAPPRTG